MYIKYQHEKRARPLIQELCREKGIRHAEMIMSKVERDYIKYAQKAEAKNCAENAVWEKAARKMKTMEFSAKQIHAVTGLSPGLIEKM
jgi:signal-transduction protein with cAMP-binding, CBS, and nucleotidyltransferase domain